MASFVNMSGKAAPERSNFAQTCNLLSQYLKGRNNLADLSQLGINGKLEAKGSETHRPPAATTMNMLPNLEKVYGPHQEDFSGSIGKSAQMTIFYGGKVIVFNDFPADKAKQIMSLATNSTGFVPSPAMEIQNPKSPPAAAADSNNAPDQLHLRPQVNGSGLPIARRASLHRFLEKRKDRIAAKAPYQVDSPPATPSSKSVGEGNPRLVLEGLSSKQLELKL